VANIFRSRSAFPAPRPLYSRTHRVVDGHAAAEFGDEAPDRVDLDSARRVRVSGTCHLPSPAHVAGDHAIPRRRASWMDSTVLPDLVKPWVLLRHTNRVVSSRSGILPYLPSLVGERLVAERADDQSAPPRPGPCLVERTPKASSCGTCSTCDGFSSMAAVGEDVVARSAPRPARVDRRDEPAHVVAFDAVGPQATAVTTPPERARRPSPSRSGPDVSPT